MLKLYNVIFKLKNSRPKELFFKTRNDGLNKSKCYSSKSIILRRNCDCFRQIKLQRSLSVTMTNYKTSLKSKDRFPVKIKPKLDTIKVWRHMTVADIAKSSKRNLDDVFEAMLYVKNSEQYDHKHSKIDDLKVITEIAKTLGYRSEIIAPPCTQQNNISMNKDAVKRPPPEFKDFAKKPPVVTIMGHVDHGKTTLLDTLRNTSVVKEEFGGITQHIGAFSVKLSNGEKVTFLDTPGHAAFSAMRARGAHATDIVVLVVAADDGVMEQTVESIKFAQDARVPIIVAINKIDKPKIDIEHTKKGLLANGIQLEDMGGDVQAVEISAKTGKNLPQLLESILTLSEIIEVKGDTKGLVEGVVIESKLDKGRGKLATILVQRGTLKKGCFLVAGTVWAKVRSMFDELGQTIQSAPPGTPVQVIGWKELPSAGEEFLELESEKRVKEVIDFRIQNQKLEKEKLDLPIITQKREQHQTRYREDLEARKLSGRLRRKRKFVEREKENVESDHPKLDIVVKGDVDGSVEAILDILETYNLHHDCELNIIHFGVGDVTESDIEVAEAFKGMVYAFNVRTPKDVEAIAKSSEVCIKDLNVIYKLIDDLKEEISKKLPLLDKEEKIGEANVLQEFVVTEGKKKLPVAGCRCTKGILKKSAMFRLIRGEEIIHEGPLASMRHLKNEVDSIKKEVECGLKLEDSNVRFQGGDILVCYEITKVEQITKWDPGF